MQILVTGGAGYIGSHVCLELLNAGYEVCVFDNLSNGKHPAISRVQDITGKKIRFCKADMLDIAALDDIFKENEIGAVIHLAGLKAVGESVLKPLSYYENNVSGTINLLKTMRKHGVKSFVFSSSATVYGKQEKMPLLEDFPLCAVNPYGQTKLTIEYILKDMHTADNSFRVSILRYFNPIGAHESGLIGEDPKGIPNNLMPYITQVAAGKLKVLSVFGADYDTKDGTGVRDYIHVIDLARGHVNALKQLEEKSGLFIYNLGTGKGVSVLELIAAFEKVNGIKIPYKITGRREGDVAVCYADPSRAVRELSWKTGYDIFDMCRDSWNWQKNNPDGFEK